MKPVTALIADDEPLLREALRSLLARAWPALQVVAMARNGREAVEMAQAQSPDIAFLDVHMPGLNGVEAARALRAARPQTLLVFVTAFDQYALQAFEHGALDYLVKPLESERLADTVQRLQQRLAAPAPSMELDGLLTQLAERLRAPAPAHSLRWLKASAGHTLRLIPIESVAYLRSDEKYTLIGWQDDTGAPAEALIRTPLKELVDQLDPQEFTQVHRSVVVAWRAIRQVVRGLNETAEIHLKGRDEVLPVSRSYLHLFRQM